MLVLGSAGLLHDAWLDKEDNSRISDFVFRWLRPVRHHSIAPGQHKLGRQNYTKACAAQVAAVQSSRSNSVVLSDV